MDKSVREEKKIIHEMDPISRRIREAEQKIRILYEISRYVSSLLDVQLVLDAVINLLVDEFKLDACSILLLDADGNLTIKSRKGLIRALVEQPPRKPSIDSYAGDCFLSGRTVIVNDAEQTDKPISTNRTVSGDIKSGGGFQ